MEDIVYAGLAILLSIAAFALRATAVWEIFNAIRKHALSGQLVPVLDQILLVLLVVELLYTVQVSFHEHGLLPEPLLVVALIAVIRRVLVVTAEIPKVPEAGDAIFRHYMYELGVLALMVMVLGGSLVLLQRHTPRAS